MKTTMWAAIAALTVVTGAEAQTAATEPLSSVTLPVSIARVLSDYETAWRAKDAVALARLFADDRIVVPNACPPMRGRQQVQECYAGSGGPLFLRAVAHATDGALGYIIGAYRDEENGPTGQVHADYRERRGRALVDRRGYGSSVSAPVNEHRRLYPRLQHHAAEARDKETFDVTLIVEISSGRILSARMENPVINIARECSDAGLTQCGDARTTPTERRIELSLVRK